MSRVCVALLAAMVALSSVPAGAAGTTSSRTTIAKKKKKKKSRRKAKRKIVSKRRSKGGKQVAMVEGRVTYGRDNMPPGWAWPPNRAMKAASKACKQDLTALGLTWEPAPREGKIGDPVVVPEMEIGGIKYTSTYKKPPFTMDCHLVHVLAGIGPDLRAIGVREVKFGSIYRNTKVRAHGQTKPILSRHALGFAMDIKAFVDDAGASPTSSSTTSRATRYCTASRMRSTRATGFASC